MFWAINKQTKERVISIYVATNLSYQNVYDKEWIADPNEIENLDELKLKGIEEIKVVYVKEKEYLNYNGKKVFTSPHFRILDKEKLGINCVPETIEHRLAKNWIYNRIINDDIKLIYSKVNKPYKYNNIINLKQLNLDINKLGIETRVTTNKSRIADVIIPFLNKDNFFGCGIVFEIQLSKQTKEREEKRTLDWIYKGYSVVWLNIEDFEILSDELIELKNDEVKLYVFAQELELNNKEIIKNLKYTISEQSKLLDLKCNEIFNKLSILKSELVDECFLKSKEEIKTSLTEFFYDKEILDKIGNCPECRDNYNIESKLKIRNSQRGRFIGCSKFPQCKYTIPYPKLKSD